MSLFSNLNFLSTVLAFGCVSFAASNFGVKLGRVSGFENRSGFQYVSDLDQGKSEKLYETIASEAPKDAPSWAKNKEELREGCRKNEKSARKGKPASQYCLVKNTVKHQLLKKGLKIKEVEQATNECNDETGNSYADDTGSSRGYLYAMAHCVQESGLNGVSVDISVQTTSGDGTTASAASYSNSGA